MAEETRLELLDKLRYVQQELYKIKEMQEKVLSIKDKPKIALNTVQQDSNDVEWQEIPYEDYYAKPNRKDYKENISKKFEIILGSIAAPFLITAVMPDISGAVWWYIKYGVTAKLGALIEMPLILILLAALYTGLVFVPIGNLRKKAKGFINWLKAIVLPIVFLFLWGLWLKYANNSIEEYATESGDVIVRTAIIASTITFVLLCFAVVFFIYRPAHLRDSAAYMADIQKVEELNNQVDVENESIRQKNESIKNHNKNLSQINAEIAKNNAQKIENAKRKNIQIDKDNRLRKIKQAELAYDAQIRLENLQDELSGDFIDGGAYPPNYLSIHAVNFFVDSVENRKADNITDLVNLYDHWVWELLKEQNAERRHQESNMKREMILKQLNEYNVVAEQTRLQTEIINKNLEHLNEYAQTAAQNTEAMSRKMDNIENSVRNAAAASAATAFNSSMARSAAQDMANNTRNIANNTKRDGVYFDI